MGSMTTTLTFDGTPEMAREVGLVVTTGRTVTGSVIPRFLLPYPETVVSKDMTLRLDATGRAVGVVDGGGA